MNNSELKNCPCCYSNNIAERFTSVCCRECGLSIDEGYSIEESRKLWNTRPAMSTWIEGEVPTVGELMEVLNDRTTWHPKSGIVFRDDVSLTSMAEAIHELFQRKLTGKV